MEISAAVRTHPAVLKIEAKDARAEPRALFELCATFAVCAVVVAVLSGFMRATEYIITTKLEISEARAATVLMASARDEYRAQLLLRSGARIAMAPGEEFVYRLGFKNMGTVTWQNSGPRFLSVYTVHPNYRESVFYHTNWRKAGQPAIMTDTHIQPGMVGFFEMTLRAPEVPGSYTEAFHLAAEDLLWLPGGGFEIEIMVAVPAPEPVPISAAPSVSETPSTFVAPAPPAPSTGYAATLLLRSHKTEIVAGPSAAIDMIVAFKNSGTQAWSGRSLRMGEVTIASTAPSFRHLSWIDPNEIVRATDEVKPGSLGFFNFTIQTPNQKGSYTPTMHLVVNDMMVPGGEIQIPVTVTADGMVSQESVPLAAVEIIPEPVLRVGLFKTDRPVMITANGNYNILQDGAVVQTIVGGQPSKVIFDFDYKTYTVTTPNGTSVYQRPVRFVTQDQTGGILTIPSYEHRPGWNKSLNDNMFRRSLEVYQADSTGNLWVVNELPMEEYLYGLAETSNPTEPEFQKTLATAARTYAFYHWSRNTKHGGHFHVDAAFDQVYRGYASEIRMPQWVESVRESRGAIVTYQNEIALTPYYSRSDGRTRDWTEVWGGSPKPWLKSVRTQYDEGQTLWGHGVGMSARDALLRARNEGTSWQNLLKYYYSGIEVVKKWN